MSSSCREPHALERWLKKESQCVAVSRSHDAEVASIQGCYLRYLEPFRERDNRYIRGIQLSVCVSTHKLSHPSEIVRDNLSQGELAVRDVVAEPIEEQSMRFRTDPVVH